MTSEYSIELQAENISNKNTKIYFQEVLSSYINGNYRSAIVVLWTTLVCDLIYKLQELSDIYNDSVAEKILKEIRKKQKENPKSPEWEAELVKLLEDRTDMFTTYEISHIHSLHQHRHLSAHPIIKEDLDLYQPNKETTRALIRNTLEFILTKPAMASNKIFNDLIIDLDEKRELFPAIEDLENYLTPKYYKYIPNQVKKYIFKQLWKFVFKLNNPDADKNRRMNIRALAILYKQNQKLINELMIGEKEYFASNINLEEEMDMKYFVAFCSKYPKLYTMIEGSHKPPILERIKQNKSLWSESFFIYATPIEYLQILENEIGLGEVAKDAKLSKKIVDFCKEHETLDKLITLYTDRYARSQSYSDADRTFDALIEPVLTLLNREQFIYLLEQIETNSQVCDRGKAYSDHKMIQEQCHSVCDSFDYAPYEKFLKSIED
jgi:hypothetical protein